MTAVRVWLLALLFAATAHGATYYVATTGSDAADGSTGTPWLTIGKAATTMTAGDTVNVLDGNYPERVVTGSNGSAGNYISYRGSNAMVRGFSIAHSYNEVAGFFVTNDAGISPSAAITLRSTAHFARIVTNIVTTVLDTRGISIAYDGAYATNVWIEGNTITNTGDIGIALDGENHVITNNWMQSTQGWDALVITANNSTITHNVFTNWSNSGWNANHTDIIQSDHFGNSNEVTTNIVFERNLVLHCEGTQIGNLSSSSLPLMGWWTFRNNVYTHLGGALNIGFHSVANYNNTYYRCTPNTSNPLRYVDGTGAFPNAFGSAHSGSVSNNIFIECGDNTTTAGYGYYGFEGSVTNCFADYNMVAGTNWVAKTAFSESNGINGGNPLFVDLSGGDLSIASGSPCKDTGVTISSFANDLAGVSRPQGVAWDIGADEFETNSLPAAITTLRVGTLILR